MTTPIPMPRSFTLKPEVAGGYNKLKVVVGAARPGGAEIALTPGVQQISLAWRGTAKLSLEHYSKTGGVAIPLGSIPAGSGLRRVVTEAATATTESFIVIWANNATEADMANQLAGLTIIPIPIG